ncbi:MAG: hypothetical protein KTR17_05775 [Cellvibrionaceae bacterium]|nr:hypothetical protein [Cellvibrionaceae bacterium]
MFDVKDDHSPMALILAAAPGMPGALSRPLKPSLSAMQAFPTFLVGLPVNELLVLLKSKALILIFMVQCYAGKIDMIKIIFR